MFGLRESPGVPQQLPAYLIAVIAIALLVDALTGRWRAALPGIHVSSASHAAVIGCAFALALWLIPLTAVPFIYFQF